MLYYPALASLDLCSRDDPALLVSALLVLRPYRHSIMSLFGTSPDSTPAANKASQSRSSLFDDESTSTPAAASQSSLFADDGNGGAASPWDLPTPKKSAKADLIKRLLPASEVPESYVDTYDALLHAGDKAGAGIGLSGLTKTLDASGLSDEDQAQIMGLVMPGSRESGTGIGRHEFNVFLALIGLAQEHEDITLDGVDERRKSKASLFCLVHNRGCADTHHRSSRAFFAISGSCKEGRPYPRCIHFSAPFDTTK